MMNERPQNGLPRGVTNNEADRLAMLERRRRAGDVIVVGTVSAA